MLQRFLFEIEMSNLLFFFTFYSSNNFFLSFYTKQYYGAQLFSHFLLSSRSAYQNDFWSIHATLKRVMMLKNSTLHHGNQLYF